MAEVQRLKDRLTKTIEVVSGLQESRRENENLIQVLQSHLFALDEVCID